MEIDIKEESELLNEQSEAASKHISFNKKNAAQSMLNLALLMANSSQLKIILDQGQDNSFHPYTVPLLIASILLLILVGMLFICIAYSDLTGMKRNDRLNKMNNVASLLIFLTLIINILIAAFGFQDSNVILSSSF